MAQKVTPCLWFDMDCEAAMNHYVKTFNDAPHSRKNSKINFIQRYEKGIETPSPADMEGKVLTGSFSLDGQEFIALDGGPIFPLTEAISMMVNCADQEELDFFWSKLSAVKESEQCGWCKDKFGLSWQIIPTRMGELLRDPDKERAHRVANAMLQMHKIVLKDLEAAAELV